MRNAGGGGAGAAGALPRGCGINLNDYAGWQALGPSREWWIAGWVLTSPGHRAGSCALTGFKLGVMTHQGGEKYGTLLGRALPGRVMQWLEAHHRGGGAGLFHLH